MDYGPIPLPAPGFVRWRRHIRLSPTWDPRVKRVVEAAGFGWEVPTMDTEFLRRLIRDKLAIGTLPHDSIPGVSGGLGQGETCQGCAEIITKPQMLMEGISASLLYARMHECART
jgi:hypothetical protein